MLSKLRDQFPNLNVKVQDKALVYFDNAATTLTPQVVIDKMNEYYLKYGANVHRGIHSLSEQATAEFEATRDAVQNFIGANKREEIIFTRGTTESINLVARSFGDAFIKQNDEIIISHLEHHSNIVPWQMLCERTGAKLKVIPINTKGELLIHEYKKLLTSKTKLVSVNYASNALGTINPIKEMITLAHSFGAKFFVDGAQAIGNYPLNMQELNCDFFAFSAHKMYGPNGVGVLYGKEEILNAMPPFHGGGDMIDTVTFEKTTYNHLPHKFEAGTPNIADVIATKTAIDFIQSIGLQKIQKHKEMLLHYATQRLEKIAGLSIIGTAEKKCAVISFVIDGIHPQDLATLLDKYGIAIRTGHHCTQPIMQFFNIPATARASFSIYNTKEEIDYFIQSLEKVMAILN